MRAGRSKEDRRTVQTLVILTILAWATQTLLSQWGFAGEVPTFSNEQFVGVSERSATVELRSEIGVAGPEIRLKDIARWAEWDAAALQETGDLVVARFEKGAATATADVHGIKRILREAGINLGSVRFVGAFACKVNRIAPRPVTRLDERTGLPLRAIPSLRGDAGPVPSVVPALSQVETSRTLKELLTRDLSEQLGIDEESLQIRWEARDERLVHLAEPEFQFDIEPRKLRRLGDLSWDVVVTGPTGKQRVAVKANVRAWQTQVVTAKPLAADQEIRANELAERRVLLDRMWDEAPLTIEQVVGQQAARDLPIGTVLGARMIEAPQAARVGQFINVVVEQGSFRLIWVGEARESGKRGQAIRVRKPGTRDEYTVVLTGPEQGRLIGAAGPAGGNVAGR